MIDLSGFLDDFAETAAAVMELDLVITIDTAVAHLVGALGKPVWVLLAFAPDWCWIGRIVCGIRLCDSSANPASATGKRFLSGLLVPYQA